MNVTTRMDRKIFGLGVVAKLDGGTNVNLFPVFEFFKSERVAQSRLEPKPKKKKAPGAPVPIMEIGTCSKTGRRFEVDTNEYMSSGERDAILASSGMGKSYLMGVILEEILDKSQQVVFIIDPEGEWHTLHEAFNNSKRAMKVIGKKGFNQFPDLRFSPDAEKEDVEDAILNFERPVSNLVRALIREGVSAVFDLSAFGKKEQLIAYSVIAEAVFRGESNLADDDDGGHPECRKVRLVIDEAHVFAPQKTDTDVKKFQSKALSVTTTIAKRGRKRNLHLMVATQRPQSLNKDVSTQANRFWLGGVQSELDYNANKSVYIEAGLTFEAVRSFKSGDFCFFGNGKSGVVFRSRKRRTKHGGASKKESTKPILNAEEANKALEQYLM